MRKGSLTEADLRLLDNYRRSFGEAYEAIVRIIREQLQLEPTGRPAKSTGAIIEKLRRESIRLSQIQDIAGCRVVMGDITEQEEVVSSLCAAFPEASVTDRRANPSHGYRAVHVIAFASGKAVEIQVRTALQHLWAELSEKFADVYDPNIKYGGGKELIRRVLTETSEHVAKLERKLVDLETLEKEPSGLPELANQKYPERLEGLRAKVAQFRAGIAQDEEWLTKLFSDGISELVKRKGQKQ